MKNRSIYIVQIAAIVLLFAFNTMAQNSTAVLLKAISSKANQVWVDKLQNYYTLNTTEFVKYNNQTNGINKFSNNSSTLPSSVDVSNPLRILLYYNQFNTFIHLDNMLSPTEQTKAEATELATLLCNSTLNGLWVYNQAELSLVRYDSKWNEVVRINNMNQAIANFAPIFMQENNGSVYLYDPNYGCVVLNMFGGIDKKIPLPNCVNFKVFNDELYYKRNVNYYVYNTLNLTETQLNVPLQNCKDIALTPQKMLVLANDTLYIYQR